MDGGTALQVVCAAAAALWMLLALTLLVGRLRARSARRPDVVRDHGEWRLPPPGAEVVADPDATRALVLRALRGDEPELRTASIVTLGRLGEQHEWAIDGLVEALLQDEADVVRAATQLDRLAPRVGTRLLPLLGHPSSVVRVAAVRLLARYGALAARHVPALTADRSPKVRAAALETLRVTASGEALRRALELLGDASPLVRAHACRTAAAIAPLASASFLVPLLADPSWWVRDAAREGLVAAGPEVAGVLAPALESDVESLRSGAALVMQDVGLVDELAVDEDRARLERILAAGGDRLREAASDRARAGRRLRSLPAVGAEGVS
jgi:HEAT repeat protein